MQISFLPTFLISFHSLSELVPQNSVKMAFSRVRVIVRPGHLWEPIHLGDFLPEDLPVLQFYKCLNALASYETWSYAEETGTTVHRVGAHRFISLPSSNENPALNTFGCFSSLLLFGGYQVPRDTGWPKSGSWASRNYPRNSLPLFFPSNPLSNIHTWK